MEELNGFRQRIKKYFHRLTKSEKRIATYLLADYEQAAFLPAAELAQHLQVSEATIVRFARSVGYNGFPEMRRALQHIFRVKVTPATRLQSKLADLNSGEGHVLSKVIDMELQYLTEAEHSIHPEDFDCAVKILLQAPRIFVFGLGPARLLAELAEFRLRRFGIPVISLVESGRDILEKLLLLEHDDVLIATAFHRVTGELVALLDHAKALKCKVILITDTLEPALKGRAEVILAARRGPVSTFHSLTVPMAILNALILTIAKSRSNETTANLDRLQELRAQSGLDVIGNVD
jgi:DNA-binding MurR/RpiR family transcriptional regulator